MKKLIIAVLLAGIILIAGCTRKGAGRVWPQHFGPSASTEKIVSQNEA